MARFYVPAQSDGEVPDIPHNVLDLLSRTSYTVFLSARFEREADIVIFTRNSVHVIEVKDKRGTITIDDKGNWLVDGELIVNRYAGRDENPVAQARNTAEALEKRLRKAYKNSGKEFKGKVYPYVLVPNANAESRANLREEHFSYVWVITSLDDLPNAIVKRDRDAKQGVDFYFEDNDIERIARDLRMQATKTINSVVYDNAVVHSSDEQQDHRVQNDEPDIPQQGPLVRDSGRTAGDQRFVQEIAGQLIHPTTVRILFVGMFLIVLFTFLAILAGMEFSTRQRALLLSRSEPAVRVNDVSTSKADKISSDAQSSLAPQKTADSAFSPVLAESTETQEPDAATPVGERWSASKGGLTLYVDAIDVGNDFRVWMTAENKTRDELTLPLFGYFFVVDDLGHQYEADPFTSTFPQNVAPGASVSGYALMKTSLDRNARQISVMFTHVFGSFSVSSIAVEGIPVR